MFTLSSIAREALVIVVALIRTGVKKKSLGMGTLGLVRRAGSTVIP